MAGPLRGLGSSGTGSVGKARVSVPSGRICRGNQEFRDGCGAPGFRSVQASQKSVAERQHCATTSATLDAPPRCRHRRSGCCPLRRAERDLARAATIPTGASLHSFSVPLLLGPPYQRVMEHSARFLRMALVFHRYGPAEARQPVGRTPPDRAAANSLKPKKGESLFAVTRLDAPAGRLGRPPRTTTGGWNLAARQEVSGHFKLQPHGPAGSLRKLIWVEGYARGPEDVRRKPKAVRV